MKLSAAIIGVGLCSFVATDIATHAEAQDWRTRALVLIGAFVVGMVVTSKQAEATTPDTRSPQAHPSTKPNPAPVAGSPTVGNVYGLGPGWNTTAKYCVSYLKDVCSPCDFIGDTCWIRFSEPIIDMRLATNIVGK